jgi:hypothetical protein
MTTRPMAERHQRHAWGVFGAPLTQINRDNGKDLTVAFKLLADNVGCRQAVQSPRWQTFPNLMYIHGA